MAIAIAILTSTCSGPCRKAPAQDASQDVRQVDEPAGEEGTGAATLDEPAAPLPGGVIPLSEPDRAVFWGSPEDDVPSLRVDSRHYVHTNEQRHFLFFKYMDCAGAGYLGVGSDQNYTMIARCKADFAWIVDYDEIVPLLHAVHRTFILESPTPEEFVSRWTEEGSARSIEMIREREAGNPRVADLEKIYAKYRKKLLAHFEAISGRKHAGKPATWLGDPGDYERIRGMFMAGRIRPMLGNLLADRAIAGIGTAARDLGVPIRAIYLTNVEELVTYNDPMRQSFRSLPVDGSSVVLRTLAYTNGYEIADNKWHYNIEKALDFQERLGTRITKIQVFMHARKETGVKGVSTLGF